MNTRELDIDAPWGKIAVKLWGNEADPAVLTVHGIMDNAGSFDGLIPLLPKYFYICIDLPGHGKSSNFPPHLPIFNINFIIVYTLVMDYLKRDKFIILAHSYGGQIGFLFAQLYPERVEKLIMLDTIHMFPVPSTNFKQYLVDMFDKYFKGEQKMKDGSAPQYTYQQAVDKIMQVRPTSVPEHVAKALLRRMLIPVGNDRFELSVDQRLKYYIVPLQDEDYILKTLQKNPVQCPVLVILASESRIQRQLLRSVLNYYKKQKNFTIKYVSGNHDVHQISPEFVAPLVEEFLVLQKSKL